MAWRSRSRWGWGSPSSVGVGGGLGRRVGGRVDGVVDGLVGGQAADGVLGVVEAVGVDALAHGRGVVVGEPGQGDVGGLVRLRQADARDVGVHAAEDRDGAVVVADVELLLAPGVRRRPGDPGHAQHGDAGQHPAGHQEAARWPRRVARLLGVDRVGLDREGHGRGSRPGRARARRCRRPGGRGTGCGIVGRCERRLRSAAAPTSIGCWSPGSSASSTMSATTHVTLSVRAGLEAGPHQLDGGVVGGAHRQHVGQPAVVEHAARAVAAEQQPVALLDLEVEEVGVDVVDAVDRLEDEVAVRVRARLLLGDPALVDEALDERVVLGDLADLAVAEEVRAAVTHVPERQLLAVEERHASRSCWCR